jgi:hypothetical protein
MLNTKGYSPEEVYLNHNLLLRIFEREKKLKQKIREVKRLENNFRVSL